MREPVTWACVAEADPAAAGTADGTDRPAWVGVDAQAVNAHTTSSVGIQE